MVGKVFLRSLTVLRPRVIGVLVGSKQLVPAPDFAGQASVHYFVSSISSDKMNALKLSNMADKAHLQLVS